jgi:hypothetical protein
MSEQMTVTLGTGPLLPDINGRRQAKKQAIAPIDATLPDIAAYDTSTQFNLERGAIYETAKKSRFSGIRTHPYLIRPVCSGAKHAERHRDVENERGEEQV